MVILLSESMAAQFYFYASHSCLGRLTAEDKMTFQRADTK